MDALEGFSDATKTWFSAAFEAPTAAQVGGWPAIASGNHTLIHAPTGSGKTLAAFLWALDRLGQEPTPPERERCRVLYISPLKALAHDVDRNLRTPLAGIGLAAQRLGIELTEISTGMRTGDTPQRDRQAMLRHPPDILITMPESLYLMLTSRAREILASVRWVIIDEIHSMAGSKRGTHLAISLERLAAITDVEPQRIGLSATQRPLEDIAAFLGGGIPDGDRWSPRPVNIVDAPRDKALDIEIVVPVADMTRPELTARPGATALAEMLLDRHGIVTRGLALAEGIAGGFSTLYPVFSAMEDAGRVRRGYFVEGLGGAQFGHPGAIDRLRSTTDTGIAVMAAADPANPYGAAIGWPEHHASRPARRAGAHVVLSDGALVAYVERGGRSALAFTDDPAIFATALAAVAPRHRRMTLERIDGDDASGSRWGDPLAIEGFVPGYEGVDLRVPVSSPAGTLVG